VHAAGRRDETFRHTSSNTWMRPNIISAGTEPLPLRTRRVISTTSYTPRDQNVAGDSCFPERPLTDF